ncbi:hypothetical protein BZA77DRAFT_348319 [Pyronema omphalodes]|nr:hypothetical protein BZA77DRAFT_348319 [Pyronema omphalodes]
MQPEIPTSPRAMVSYQYTRNNPSAERYVSTPRDRQPDLRALSTNYSVPTPAPQDDFRNKRQRLLSYSNNRESDGIVLDYDGAGPAYRQSTHDSRVRASQNFQYKCRRSPELTEYDWVDNGTAYKAAPQYFKALKEMNEQRKETETADKVVPEALPQEKVVKRFTQQYFDMEEKHEGQEERMRIAKILQNFWAGRADGYPISEPNQESDLYQIKSEPIEDELASPPRQSLSPTPDSSSDSDTATPSYNITSATTENSLTLFPPPENETDAAHLIIPDIYTVSDKSLSILQDMKQRLEMIQQIVDTFSSQQKLTDLRVKAVDTEMKEINQNYKALQKE